MYVPEKLKLNKFRDVRIPSPAEYFGRFGTSVPPVSENRMTGDEDVMLNGRKTDILADMDAYDKYMQEEESNKK